MPVTSAQCIIETEKYPDVGKSLNEDDDDYSQVYGQVRSLNKRWHPSSIKIFDNFRSSIVGADDICYNIHIFVVTNQQNSTASQPAKAEFKFDGVVPNDMNVHAFVLTSNLVSVNSDWQRHFDFI